MDICRHLLLFDYVSSHYSVLLSSPEASASPQRRERSCYCVAYICLICCLALIRRGTGGKPVGKSNTSLPTFVNERVKQTCTPFERHSSLKYHPQVFSFYRLPLEDASAPEPASPASTGAGWGGDSRQIATGPSEPLGSWIQLQLRHHTTNPTVHCTVTVWLKKGRKRRGWW